MTVKDLMDKLREYKWDTPVYVVNTKNGNLFNYTLVDKGMCDEDPNLLHFMAPSGPITLLEDDDPNGHKCVVLYGRNR